MTAYYNEYDPKAAAWLRALIKRGLIADGVVDERSILDVTAADLDGFTQCHFFAGIGGWSYALRLAEWPDDKPVWTGSPPCQPFSAAGQQKGKDDERHLAPHFAALVAAGRPDILFGEQVASSAVFGKAPKRAGAVPAGEPEWAWLDDLFGRLEAAHYACGASDIPAAGVGAAHIRQRTFFGAQRLDDPAGPRHDGPFAGPEGLARNETWLRLSGAGSGHGGLADAAGERLEGRVGATGGQPGEVERPAGLRAADGLADADNAGPQGRDGKYFDTGRRQNAARHTGPLRIAGRMADADGGDASAQRKQRGGKQRQQPQDGGVGGLADALHAGRPDAYHGGWSNPDWLFCRDGKWRPVEPGTFPLAHGLPARVGRLRGYGNAIVPQAAAEFIKAFSRALMA